MTGRREERREAVHKRERRKIDCSCIRLNDKGENVPHTGYWFLYVCVCVCVCVCACVCVCFSRPLNSITSCLECAGKGVMSAHPVPFLISPTLNSPPFVGSPLGRRAEGGGALLVSFISVATL